jgi:hypothetical protein
MGTRRTNSRNVQIGRLVTIAFPSRSTAPPARNTQVHCSTINSVMYLMEDWRGIHTTSLSGDTIKPDFPASMQVSKLTRYRRERSVGFATTSWLGSGGRGGGRRRGHDCPSDARRCGTRDAQYAFPRVGIQLIGPFCNQSPFELFRDYLKGVARNANKD